MKILEKTASNMCLFKITSLKLGLGSFIAAFVMETITIRADMAFQIKGQEFDLVPNLVGDQIDLIIEFEARQQ